MKEIINIDKIIKDNMGNNQGGEMFCRNCGRKISIGLVACPACGVGPLAEKKFCPSCGAATTDKQALCTQCGITLPTGGSQPPSQPVQQPSQTSDSTKKDESSGAFCGGAICMCIVIVVLAYFFGQQ